MASVSSLRQGVTTMKKLSQVEMYGEILTPETQYRHDIAQLPRRTEAERQALIEQARQGNEQARGEFVLTFAGYITSVARKYANITSALSMRIEFLDLVQVGNLIVLERMENAFASPNPIGYLHKSISGAIITHCHLNKSLIKPGIAKGNKPLPDYEIKRLDAPAGRQDNGKRDRLLVDVLVAPETLAQPEKDYSDLHQAIENLPENQRDLITRCYGIDCAPETPYAIAAKKRAADGKPPKTNIGSSFYVAEKRARAALKRALEQIAECA